MEARQLLTTPSFGWTLNAPAGKPVVWVDANGSGLTSTSGFNAENLNGASGSFNTSKGTDGSGRATFGPASGMPADGNYEFTLPGSAFSPAASEVMATDFFVNADFNHDRVVDFSDLVIIAQHYESGVDQNGDPVPVATNNTFATGDANGDGKVNDADLSILTAHYNRRLAAAPTYEGEVTVSSLAVQPDGTTPLVVNWAPISDATVQASDPSNANKTIAGYTVYRSTDSTNFTQIDDVPRASGTEPSLYEYTDSTPVDGTKYWYRIRPYYAVTQPDGSSGFQHLPTTNKAWKVSAILSPTYVDAVYAGNTVFVTWTDYSSSESSYIIEMLDNGSWNTVGTVSAGATSFAMSDSLLGDTLDFRVTATRSDLTISSLPVETTASLVEVPSGDVVDADLTRRIDINTFTTGYLYEAGVEHAGETIIVENEDGDSGIVTGTYTLNATGSVLLPNSGVVLPTSVKKLSILFADERRGVLFVGPELVPAGTITKTPAEPHMPVTKPPTNSATVTLTPAVNNITVVTPTNATIVQSPTGAGGTKVVISIPNPRPAKGTRIPVGLTGDDGNGGTLSIIVTVIVD